jgi:uncharacterized protein (DUF362 family)
LDLLSEYPVELVDLNDCPFKNIVVSGGDGRAIILRASRLLLDSSKYIISASRMKTHDTVIVSLSIKNLAMASIFMDDKKTVHQGIRETNRYIAGIAGQVWPNLSVINGFEGMEGDGPSHGEAVPLGIAISSTDALVADRVGCEIMGVDLHDVGYLHYCAEWGLGEADLKKIEVLGGSVEDCASPFSSITMCGNSMHGKTIRILNEFEQGHCTEYSRRCFISLSSDAADNGESDYKLNFRTPLILRRIGRA